MFKNLDAEQARYGHSNEYVAKQLSITRTTYENKKQRGNFKLSEIRKLCDLYECDFYYLFAEGEPSRKPA